MFPFRNAVTLSPLLFVLTAVGLAQEAALFQTSPHSVEGAQHAGVEPAVGPQLPCGVSAIPSYPDLGNVAVTKSWSKSELGRDWKPPACTGWTDSGFTTLVTIASRFPGPSDARVLLGRIGAISELTGVQYWSTTHKRWQTLIVDAHALTDSSHGQRRKDFTSDEMKQGNVLYFEQVDNLTGKAVYRLQIVEASASRVVFKVENVSTMRYYLMPVLHAGELQSMYFLDHESDNNWRCYGVVRTGKSANGLLAGNERSAINRATAYYRYLVGIPSTQEPPAAR